MSKHRLRKRTGPRVKTDEPFGRLAFEANPLPMWVYDPATLAFLAVNDAAVRRYGYSRNQFLAMTIEAIRPPEDLPLLRKNLESAPAGFEESGPWRHRDSAGSIFHVRVLSSPLRVEGREARLVLALDITDSLRSERENLRSRIALAQSEASFRAMVENAVFGMYRSNPTGRFTMVNQKLVDLLGYDTPDELMSVAIPHDIFLNPDVRTTLVSDSGNIDVFETREAEWRRKDGSAITVRVSGHAVRDENGSTIAYEGFVEDVTDRHALEQQLRQSQKLEAIGLLAGGIAHDFNNLLTTILTTTELLTAEHASNPELQSELQVIKHVGLRGAELIRQLLTFSRRQPLELKPVNLGDLVTDAVRMVRRVMREDIEIGQAIQRSATDVKADTGALEHILLNLMTNARDAMPRGGKVLIQVYTSTLDAEYCAVQGWDSPGPYVVLAVSDTGTGMDLATRNRVFEPFFTTKPPGQGTGLGLSSVYGLAKQHGGFAHVYSEPGRGTSVKVYFPAVAPGADAAEVRPPAAPRGGTETILIAEDETALRRAARRALERFGYRVLEAADGTEALDRYRTHASQVDLILSDVVMPKLGGPQFVAALRSEGCTVPVLYMSGYTARDIEQASIMEPGAPLLQKPWTITDLLTRARELLDQAPARASTSETPASAPGATAPGA